MIFLIDWDEANRRSQSWGHPPLTVSQQIVGTFAAGMAYDGRYVEQIGARVGSFGPAKEQTHVTPR